MAGLESLRLVFWNGTIPQPSNPAFWQQATIAAPKVIAGLLFALGPTRRIIAQSFKWMFGMQVLSRKQREALRTHTQRPPEKRTTNMYGDPKHGRLVAIQNMQIKPHHVQWASNGAQARTLTPGDHARSYVTYDRTGETMGWARQRSRAWHCFKTIA